MIKPIYLVWDDESKRYIHNTTRDFGIYSSKAEEFFSREDLDEAFDLGSRYGLAQACGVIKTAETVNKLVDKLIEHDGKPYKESNSYARD